ncbi:MAG: hypothetical protein ABII18_06800 [bacterium]|nr:hypothetical protein [bacterium]MBU1917348.1 hypothetical protein [bacterium]
MKGAKKTLDNTIFDTLDNTSNSQCCSQLTLETITELELALTNSAIGYEYAKVALDSVGTFDMVADNLIVEIEKYKNEYFHARHKLERIDKGRLGVLENNLKAQKLMMFESSACLH